MRFIKQKATLNTSPPKRKCESVNRKKWTDEAMRAAMNAVQKEGIGRNIAADLHGVPRTTLKDRLNGHVVHGTKPGPCSY